MSLLDSNDEAKNVEPLLRRFFESEMPRPWPAWQTPAPSSNVIRPLAADNLPKSRLSLLIAVSLMIGCALLTSSMIGSTSNTPRPEKGLMETGTAKVPKELRKDQK